MSHVLFKYLKYSTFLFLTCNVIFFFRKEHTASDQVFLKGIDWSNFIEAYSSSIDATAWLSLLFILEIETCFLSEKIKGVAKLALNSFKTILYLIIVYAFYGYLIKYNNIASETALSSAQHQAFVDMINSADWLLIVFILEIESYKEIRGKLTKQVSFIIKVILYTVLFANAVYFGIMGNILDFWDAFLWIIAFVFIELRYLKEKVED
tara:strand:+ start:1047 stop:1670 length:624 start_codon:yes stop_codon:yes gene_type:complete